MSRQRPQQRDLTITQVGGISKTANENLFLECATNAGCVAFWGSQANTENITELQKRQPPLDIRCGCIAPSSAFQHHDLWVPESEGIQFLETHHRVSVARALRKGSSMKFNLAKEQLGLLVFEVSSNDINHVLTGTIRCPHCSDLTDVNVYRNVSAVTDKQPAFLIFEASDHAKSRQVGHLFVGTIRTSPVLYFGELHHCGSAVRAAVFFNRAFRVSSDAQLVVATQKSPRGEPSAEENPF